MATATKSKFQLFRVAKGASAYTIYADLTGTTEAAAANDAALTITMLEETKVDRQADGSAKIDLTNHMDNADFWDALDVFCPPEAGSSDKTDAEWYQEDGVKYGGAASSSATNLLLAVSYGNTDSAGDVKTTVALGYLDKTSGSYSQKFAEDDKPTVAFVGVVCSDFDLTIPAAIFDATILSASEVATAIPKIPRYKGIVTKRVAKAA